MSYYSDRRNNWQGGESWNAKRPKLSGSHLAGQDFNPYNLGNTHDAKHSSSTMQFMSNNTNSINVQLNRYENHYEKSFFKCLMFAYQQDNIVNNVISAGAAGLGELDYSVPRGREGIYGTKQPTLLMHLPLLNFHLLKTAIELHETNAVQTIQDIMYKIQFCGVIDSAEYLVDIHAHQSPDTRKLVVSGSVDIYNIFSGRQNLGDNIHEHAAKVTTNSALFFIIRPIFPGQDREEVKLNYTFDDSSDTKSIDRNDVEPLHHYFVVIPWVTTGDAPNKTLYVRQNQQGETVSGGYWRVGRVENGVNYMYNDFQHKSSDPICNYQNIVRAPLMSVQVDIMQAV